MKIEWIAAAVAALHLSACSSFQPNETERNVDFPLDYCTSHHLTAAYDKVTEYSKSPNPTALKFDSTWVCRTNTVQKLTPILGESEDQRNKRQLEMQALKNREEQLLRERLETPFLRTEIGRPRLGVALSGGGTKAAAVATGVLAGLDDAKILDTADYISSVSGGGFASYFYYAHRVLHQVRTEPELARYREKPTTTDLYRDCIIVPPKGAAEKMLRERILAVGGCDPGELLYSDKERGKNRERPMENRYQAFLRCQQDVFKPANCATGSTRKQVGIQGEVFWGTLFAIAPAFISSTLFDWGNTISPAARTYRDGIGIAYGSTISRLEALGAAEHQDKYHRYPCEIDDKGFALDCTPNIFNPDPVAMNFDELRKGLMTAKKAGSPMPFWVINAAAPLRRNAFGWVTPVKADITNADIFEMTAVSHGSGRYGYVTTPPSLYTMTVLDSVTASAAFMDANNLLLPVSIRGVMGFGMHLAALDWGQDIPNFNTGDNRRRFHRFMPIPFTWLDSLVARNNPETDGVPERVDRARSVYIRLMDGGNAENLGAFSLLKRKVQNIVISDAGQDTDGRFDDICGLQRRIANAPADAVARHLYIPGLAGLEAHCKHNDDEKRTEEPRSYNLHAWKFDKPVLAGCLRTEVAKDLTQPCKDLKLHGDPSGKVTPEALDTRLYIVKPAVNHKVFLDQFVRDGGDNRKLVQCWVRGEESSKVLPAGTLNCDTAYYMATNWKDKKGNCQTFPQHSTAFMTVDSDEVVFSAYRELARQYVTNSAITSLASMDPKEQKDAFEADALLQWNQRIFSEIGLAKCDLEEIAKQ